MKSIITNIIIGSVIASTVNAAPAFPGTIVFKQKDGSTFEGKLKGDEYFSWVEDKAEHIILFNKTSKRYEYAKVVKTSAGETSVAPSGMPVVTSSLSSAPSRTAPLSTIPKIDRKILYQIWRSKRYSAGVH